MIKFYQKMNFSIAALFLTASALFAHDNPSASEFDQKKAASTPAPQAAASAPASQAAAIPAPQDQKTQGHTGKTDSMLQEWISSYKELVSKQSQVNLSDLDDMPLMDARWEFVRRVFPKNVNSDLYRPAFDALNNGVFAHRDFIRFISVDSSIQKSFLIQSVADMANTKNVHSDEIIKFLNQNLDIPALLKYITQKNQG